MSSQLRQLIWAGLSLGLGFWACQRKALDLPTDDADHSCLRSSAITITLESQWEGHTDSELLLPRTTSLALSFCAPFLLIISGFLVFDYHSNGRKVWVWILSGSIIGLAGV